MTVTSWGKKTRTVHEHETRGLFFLSVCREKTLFPTGHATRISANPVQILQREKQTSSYTRTKKQQNKRVLAYFVLNTHHEITTPLKEVFSCDVRRVEDLDARLTTADKVSLNAPCKLS